MVRAVTLQKTALSSQKGRRKEGKSELPCWLVVVLSITSSVSALYSRQYLLPGTSFHGLKLVSCRKHGALAMWQNDVRSKKSHLKVLCGRRLRRIRQLDPELAGATHSGLGLDDTKCRES